MASGLSQLQCVKYSERMPSRPNKSLGSLTGRLTWYSNTRLKLTRLTWPSDNRCNIIKRIPLWNRSYYILTFLWLCQWLKMTLTLYLFYCYQWAFEVHQIQTGSIVGMKDMVGRDSHICTPMSQTPLYHSVQNNPDTSHRIAPSILYYTLSPVMRCCSLTCSLNLGTLLICSHYSWIVWVVDVHLI